MNTPVDISNRTCDSIINVRSNDFPLGVMAYSIIGLSGDALYIADDSDPNRDGTSAARRHDKLVLDFPLKKSIN